ncbi:MAG: hypothetical protein WC665_01165 [Sulfurimonas sp.]|jgi:hypothetical protein
MKNSKNTREFRDSTVQLAINGEQSALKIAADLDINPKITLMYRIFEVNKNSYYQGLTYQV